MLFLLPQAVDNAAEKVPEHLAFRFSGQSLTYGELARRSNGMARLLLEQGVKRGDRVGIFMNKNLHSPVAMYGIMKAGAAYVPLDPFAPTSRIGFVISDCGIRHIVTSDLKLEQSQLLQEERGIECLIGVDGNYGGLRRIPWDVVSVASTDTPPSVELTEQDLAYILYTSGSTGTPKGIMHTHRSGLSFAMWAAENYGLTCEDRISSHAPLHFDLSTFDFFAAAIAGATTIAIPEGITKLPASMSKLIQDEQITIWYSVPFALIQLLERGGLQGRDMSSLRWVLFAGEVFPAKHLRNLQIALPHLQLSNLYGPTETNVCTSYNVPSLMEDSDEPIPIGKPCANVETLVLGTDDRPVASNEVGELLIRGGVVMRGYWGRPDLNQSAFFRRRMFDHFEDVFYRTGDLVQREHDGNFKYLGRKDRQIKTRGYRVELDEIEAVLLSHRLVKEAATYAIPDGEGSNIIEAAVAAKNQSELTEETLLSHLTDSLPSYAIPVKIHILDALPRGSTGKVDRCKLLARATALAQNT